MPLDFENLRILFTLVIVIFFSIGLVFYCLTNYSLLKKRSLRSLLWGFKAKMWMTFGLGTVFFGFYFFLVWIASLFIDQKTGLFIFFKIYEYPGFFVYVGLIIFVSFSFIIYFVRMIIKYLFLTRGKGD